MNVDVNSDSLQHHGILGMKWGIRRYQNPDGSLTTEGKIRYARSVYRGNKALDRNKNRGTKYKTAAVKVAARAGILTALGKGFVLNMGYGMTLAVAAPPAVMPALLGIAAAFTVNDLYKAIRQDADISNAYNEGDIQKKYRETYTKFNSNL